jgi:non-ribosomal peptide synthase protein (TIGR01720 family)
MVLACQEAGLPITHEDVDRHETIAALSEALDARQEIETNPETRSMIGEAALTGNQAWILEQTDFMYSVSVIRLTKKTPSGQPASGSGQQASGSDQPASGFDRPLDAALLERAIQHLTYHHDALRLRCRRNSGGWEAEYVGHTSPGLVSVLDLSRVASEDRQKYIDEEFGRVRDGIDVEKGPLLRIGLVRLGVEGDLVGVGIHHIISDTISAAILIRDLDTVYSRLLRGEQPSLPHGTSSIGLWLTRAAELAWSREVRRQAVYWIDMASHERTGLSADYPERPGITGRDRVVSAWFGRERTARLRALGRVGLSLAHLIHYALARALSEEVGSTTVQFRTMSHGRAPIAPDVDLSRTVGFLARDLPLVLAVDRSVDPLDAARAVQTQMRAMPNHGMGYRILLDHADHVLSRRLRSGSAPPIQLNYDGDLDQLYGGLATFRRIGDWGEQSPGVEPECTVPWHNRLDITASIEDGDLLLWMTYHDRAYRAGTIERFASRMFESLSELVDHARP